MKTSKIIFISLLSTIALFILAAAVDIRITGTRKTINPSDIRVKRQTVPSFKVLYVNNSRYFDLIQNDSSFIEVSSLKIALSPYLNYTINEDTLFVSDFNPSGKNIISIKIFSNNALKKILLKNSEGRIYRFDSGRLSLDLDRSNVYFNQDKSERSSVKALDILARNKSRINIFALNVDSLGIVLNHSEAIFFNTSVKKICGTLSDNSRIVTPQAGEISLKKDATSQIRGPM